MSTDSDLSDAVFLQFAEDFDRMNGSGNLVETLPPHREKMETYSTNHRAKSGNIVGGCSIVGD